MYTPPRATPEQVINETIAVPGEFPVASRSSGGTVTQAAIPRPATPARAKTVNVAAKAVLVLLLTFALLFPDLGQMRDKAAGLRAVGYPLLRSSYLFCGGCTGETGSASPGSRICW